jgi:hypothetical protein
MEEIMQSRTLIILLTIALLTACAPANIATSTPTITAQPPTATADPSPTVTVTSTPVPTEIPATPTPPEKNYTLVITPSDEKLSSMTPLTEDDISSVSFADWAKGKCPAPDSPNVVFSAMVKPNTDGKRSLDGIVDEAQALNVSVCTIAPLASGIYGLPTSEKMFAIIQNVSDANGNEAQFMIPIGKRGLTKMEKDGFFDPSMRGKSRMVVLNKLSRDNVSQFITGAPFDANKLVSQEVLDMYFDAIVANNGFVNRLGIKDADGNVLDITKFLKTHLVPGVPGQPIKTAN